MKKLVSILMASVLLLSVSGCGQEKKAAKGEDPNTVPSDPYEIQWYIKYSPQKDVDLVEEELNKYLKDKINATVNMVMLDPGQYNDKVSTMIKSGEYSPIYTENSSDDPDSFASDNMIVLSGFSVLEVFLWLLDNLCAADR